MTRAVPDSEVADWQRGSLAERGRLIGCFESSISNYTCGCPPLIDLCDLLVKTEGVYGA